jgi:succinate dehydrogenase / fumarate reductase flavoprotein subunit
VVRRNAQLEEAIGTVNDLHDRAKKSSLSDTGSWSNQNVVFTKALLDMFPIAKLTLKGALQRDECRGAHFKPDFAMPSLESKDAEGRRREAEKWCDRFAANTDKWLKSTIAVWDGEKDQPELHYEDVDTSLIPPRPRLYGIVGGDVIEKVWKERRAKEAGNGQAKDGANASTVASS